MRTWGNNFRKEDGMATFMVTTVLIMVISLTLIGFSQVARKNQRDALDRQLSTQAFYAAEAGINQAVSVIQAHATSGLPPEKTNCNNDSNYPAVELSGQDVKVTCLLVKTKLDSLVYGSVGESNPTVAVVKSVGGTPISKLIFKWSNPTVPTNPATSCSPSTNTTFPLPVRASWNCGFGILRADIAATPDGSTDPASTIFFYPRRYAGATLDASNAKQLDVQQGENLFSGDCVNDGSNGDDNRARCMVAVINLSESTYYINLRSIYHNSKVTINALDTSGNSIDLTGQVMVDSTAKAQDVLRRVQVRVPLNPSLTSTLPGYAIETTDSLCKRFVVQPNFYDTDPAVSCP